MPRVDFYLLENEVNNASFLLACKLLEKAYLRNHRVYVHCSDKESAHKLDELLWTFKDNSFIPHNLVGETLSPPPAIQIGFSEEPRGFNDILFNLTSEIPSFYNRFKRVIEIVGVGEETKNLSRNRYKAYRAQGCELQMHTINLG